MNYTKAQLVDALVAEWEYLCHDDPDPDDPTPEEYREQIKNDSYEDLVERTVTGEFNGYTLDEYMEDWL